jgi:EAL and modified HD-GYP domain-containing signal transduction protein
MQSLTFPSVSSELEPCLEPDRYFARQPIFDRNGRLYAYELLFRSGPENKFGGDSDTATRMMLDNFLLFGADAMTGSSKAFLNCTREVLVNNLVSLLSPRSTVLEILEDIEPDSEVMTACKKLKKEGYKVSLDDYVPRAGMEPLITIADYIKVDFRLSDASERKVIRRQIAATKALLVAEKIEDESEYRIALAEGYDLFQGYFFARPAVVSKHSLHCDTINYLKLLAVLNHAPLEWSEVERCVKVNPSLAYRLLRMVNSGLYLVGQDITSIKMALVLLGEARFRKLVTVAALPVEKKGRLTDESVMVLHRALFCELLASRIGQPPGEQYLFGLLSLFPMLLKVTPMQLIELLPLRNSVESALLGEHNEVSRSIEILQNYEMGNSTPAITEGTGSPMIAGEIGRLYVSSLKDVHRILESW